MKSMEKALYIIIGCDTDPDRPGFIDGADEKCGSWQGIEEGIPSFKDTVENLKDSAGNTPKVTWLLRVDEQVKVTKGDYAWVLNRYKKGLTALETDGDELGWHPHFYKQDRDGSKWYQEVADTTWQVKMLDEAYKAYQEVFPGRAGSVRMGWDFHNNATMKKLSELGVKTEFSALPGLRTNMPSGTDHVYNIFDWFISPRNPYFPSSSDYRRGPREGEKPLDILEVPIFTSSSFIWGAIGGLQFARKMKDPSALLRAIKRPSYVINITGKPKLFAPLLNDLDGILRRDNRSFFFATYFHADELLDNKSSLYSRYSLRDNLASIIRICEKQGRSARFICAGDSRQLVMIQ
jgi:hypothetical protein